MSDGFPGKPRILRGAFVEVGLTLPPLVVVFQFNPLQLTRSRSLTFDVPGAEKGVGERGALRKFHAEHSSLTELQKLQVVKVDEERISFELRLDATGGLDERRTISEQFGIAPQIATLELMVHPKEESLAGAALARLVGVSKGFSFTRTPNPPLVLFVFGRRRVLPVNITSLDITETEFSADLDPVRATVAVDLTVIEGTSVPYRYSKLTTEAMAAVNLAGIADVANVVIPG